jgi:hypothetical protein
MAVGQAATENHKGFWYLEVGYCNYESSFGSRQEGEVE